MRRFRENNREHARRLWRQAYWRKKGFENYDGIALGGMETSTELRKKVEQLRHQIHRWNYEYYVWAAPTVEDAEYDRAFEELKALEAAHPELEDSNSPTRRVGAPVLAGMDKTKHKVPMLSLDKAKTADQVASFFGKAHEGLVEPKVDGASLSISYINGRLIRAVTRGNGTEGSDVTHNVRTIRTLPLLLPKKLTLEVRGEVFIKWSDFEKYNAWLEKTGEEPDANPRNTAAGALGLKDPKEAAQVPLSFIAYQIVGPVEGVELALQTEVLDLLEEMQFITPSALPKPLESCENMFQQGFRLNDVAEIKDLVHRLDVSRRLQDFPTDGLVFKINDLATQSELGTGTTFPKWAVAFKFKPDRVKTAITKVMWTVGKTGKITPVAEFNEVLISGSRVARASLCNRDEIKRLNVNVGDEVLIEKSNEIIPKVVELVAKHSKGQAAVPETCPVCKSKLTSQKGYVDIFCVAPDCLAQAEAKLVYAVGKSALYIDGCGRQAVALCIQNKILTLPDLLAEEQFAFFKGAARKKMIDGIAKAFTAPFWRKLSALCIDGWGKTTSQEAAARWPTIGALIDAFDTGQMAKILGEVKAKSFDLYIQNHAKEAARLAELNFLTEQADATEEASSTEVQGKSFCLTGEITGLPRHKAEEEIRKRGGITKSGVGRKLDYLIVAENPGSTKLTAARRWGTKCITPDQLFDMLHWRPSVEAAVDTDKDY